MAYRLKGLGQAPTDYSSYMSLCMAGHTASCNPLDQVCIAQQVAASDICGQDYLTDPNSPHNTTTPSAVPTPPNVSNVTSLPQAQALAESEYQQPMPGTVIPTTVVSSAPPASTPATVVQSSGAPAPAVTPATVIQSSGASATQQAAAQSSSGFDFSSVPWWAWAGVAALGVFALSQQK